MTADCPQDFPYEAADCATSTDTRRLYWDMATGLQKVDGLNISSYMESLREGYVEGAQSPAQIADVLREYYKQTQTGQSKNVACDASAARDGEREADNVSSRILELLDSNAFSFAPEILSYIHEHLFQDLDSEIYRPGQYKELPLQKQEHILNGDSVLYVDPSLIERSLNYLFREEAQAVYRPEFDEEQLEHFARFIALLWQTHPFCEGNTRTIAVFAALYLRHLGFDANNEPFAEDAEYFRNALVRANYRNAKAGVMPNLDYLARFFDNMLNDAGHELLSGELVVQALYDDPSLLRNVPTMQALVI